MPKHKFTANELRWAGEAADGERDKDFGLVEDGDKLVLVAADDSDRYPTSIHVKTESGGEGGLKGEPELRLYYKGRVIDPWPDPKGPQPDAIFLTQSAVEKFVLPFYTRVMDPANIDKLQTRLYKKNVIAAVHIPPSSTDPVTTSTIAPIVRGADDVARVGEAIALGPIDRGTADDAEVSETIPLAAIPRRANDDGAKVREASPAT